MNEILDICETISIELKVHAKDHPRRRGIEMRDLVGRSRLRGWLAGKTAARSRLSFNTRLTQSIRCLGIFILYTFSNCEREREEHRYWPVKT